MDRWLRDLLWTIPKIHVEKNGFHRLTDRHIGVLYHIEKKS